MTMNITIPKSELFEMIDRVVASDNEALVALIESDGVRLSEDSKRRRDDLVCVAVKTEIDRWVEMTRLPAATS